MTPKQQQLLTRCINLAANWRGSKGEFTISTDIVGFLQSAGMKPEGERQPNGGLKVKAKAFCEAVKQLKAAAESESEAEDIDDDEQVDDDPKPKTVDQLGLPEDVVKLLTGAGINTVQDIHDGLDAGNKLTEINGIGDATAKKILQAVGVDN